MIGASIWVEGIRWRVVWGKFGGGGFEWLNAALAMESFAQRNFLIGLRDALDPSGLGTLVVVWLALTGAWLAADRLPRGA